MSKLNGYTFRLRRMKDGKISKEMMPVFIDDKDIKELKEEKTLLYGINKLKEKLCQKT